MSRQYVPNPAPAVPWSHYVRQVVGGDRQVDAAARTGVDQTTISRWLNGKQDTPGRPLRIQSVVAFARGYRRPVVEALLTAGLIEPADVDQGTLPAFNLRTVPDVEFAAELLRRLTATTDPGPTALP